VGIVLGEAIREALGDKRGISRFGFLAPMDESIAEVALDLSNRPKFVWSGEFMRERIGDLPTELIPHFFESLTSSLRCALHISVRGENEHHKAEAVFKGVGRALRSACAIDCSGYDVPSTKGVL
jgi:imidazoleglycerol-phosphate dehydratase/histidinol-phosphatase